MVRLAPAAADADHLVPGFDQPGDQVRTHVPGTAYHNDTHGFLLFVFWWVWAEMPPKPTKKVDMNDYIDLQLLWYRYVK
jgi:hypothetical protein